MPVDMTDPAVQALATEVTIINEFLAKQTYEGMAFDGLFRGFNQGDHRDFRWNMGGRLYAVGGGYQAMPKGDRPHIRINGEPTVEIDLIASHLTILHALESEPMPVGDPYDIAGLPRSVVKGFVTMILGNEKIQSKWSNEVSKKYADNLNTKPIHGLTGKLSKDFPFKIVKEKVLDRVPLLRSWDSLKCRWYDLQFMESQVLVSTILTLIADEVPALPIHDSIIVPDSKSLKAIEVLTDTFKDAFGTSPSLNLKKRGREVGKELIPYV